MTQTFVESCVDFEVAHLSVLMVWRLSVRSHGLEIGIPGDSYLKKVQIVCKHLLTIMNTPQSAS